MPAAAVTLRKRARRIFADVFALPPSQMRVETLSGLTVALALVPEAVAFALVAQVHPLNGLYAAFFVGLITALIGGRPGMISGATGALAVVMVSLVVRHGIEYLFAAVVLMGVIEIAAGALRLGKFIRIVPHPVMLGFVNGLAIVIGLAQLEQFKVATPDGGHEWLSGQALWLMLGLAALAMAIIHFLPKLTKAVPSSLAAIAIVFALVWGLDLDTRSVGDMASISGGLPEFHIPMVPLSFETLAIILPYSLIFAGIGLIESLLTLQLIDELTETKGRNSMECIAQGVANTVTGFFGGMGGCAMIGQSMINISSGARHRLSGVVAAAMLLIFIVFLSPVIEAIPMAALVGVMMMVVVGTFAWSSLQIMHRIPLSDAVVIVIVTVVTVVEDLAIAVLVGVVLSALVHAWRIAGLVTARTERSEDNSRKIYHLNGPLMFSSVETFRELFQPRTDPDLVIADFEHCRVWDHSGVEALKKLAERYEREGKTIRFRKLSEDCARRLGRYGEFVDRDPGHDPHYELIVDREEEPGAAAR